MRCQFCGGEIPEGDQFCGQCGARAPVGIGASTPAPEGEQPGVARAPRSTGEAVTRDPARQIYYDRDPNAPAVAARYEYASFWPRFGAWLLDTLFALILAAIPGAVVAVLLVLLVEAGQDPPLTFAEAEQQDDDTGAAAFFGFLLGFTPVLLAYWYIGTALGGAWGKRIFGIRIVKYDDGARPGFGTGAIRVLMTWLISLISLAWLLDHLWMIWDKEKQTWHDKAAGTVVVRS